MDNIFQQTTQFFYDLTPDTIFKSVESFGFRCTGRMFTLNSMENRVYEVEIEVDTAKIKSPSEKYRVIKFYRPGRWTKEQIQEEHQFLFDLEAAEISVICPLKDESGQSVKSVPDAPIFFTVFPKSGGRSPDELSFDQLEIAGRSLARLHTVGKSRDSKRMKLNADNFAKGPLELLLKGKFIPSQYEAAMSSVITKFAYLGDAQLPKWNVQRIHGDCHLRNILWTDTGAKFLDFDDMLVGPPVQDLWLIMPGRQKDFPGDWDIFLEAYESMQPFQRGSMKLIELLRGLRMIHYCAWIAKRWEDPFFKRAFPYFGTEDYWRKTLRDFEEQYQHTVTEF